MTRGQRVSTMLYLLFDFIKNNGK